MAYFEYLHWLKKVLTCNSVKPRVHEIMITLSIIFFWPKTLTNFNRSELSCKFKLIYSITEWGIEWIFMVVHGILSLINIGGVWDSFVVWDFALLIEAIQIIGDILGGRGRQKCHMNLFCYFLTLIGCKQSRLRAKLVSKRYFLLNSFHRSRTKTFYRVFWRIIFP